MVGRSGGDHLVAMEGTSSVLSSAANAVKNLYLESGQEVRDAIETGFLEHALESKALRPYFEDWASDARLQAPWNRALAWGEAHPDYMAGLFSAGSTKKQRVNAGCGKAYRSWGRGLECRKLLH
jgi:hypothetical protein